MVGSDTITFEPCWSWNFISLQWWLSLQNKVSNFLLLFSFLSSHVYVHHWDQPSCKVRREGEDFLCEWWRVLHGERSDKPFEILVQVRNEFLSVAPICS